MKKEKTIEYRKSLIKGVSRLVDSDFSILTFLVENSASQSLLQIEVDRILENVQGHTIYEVIYDDLTELVYPTL